MRKMFLFLIYSTLITGITVNAQEIISYKAQKKLLHGSEKPVKIETTKRDSSIYKAIYFGKHQQNVYETKQIVKTGEMFFRVEEDGRLIWIKMELTRTCQKIIGDAMFLNPEKGVVVWAVVDKHDDQGKEYFSQPIRLYIPDKK